MCLLLSKFQGFVLSILFLKIRLLFSKINLKCFIIIFSKEVFYHFDGLKKMVSSGIDQLMRCRSFDFEYLMRLGPCDKFGFQNPKIISNPISLKQFLFQNDF